MANFSTETGSFQCPRRSCLNRIVDQQPLRRTTETASGPKFAVVGVSSVKIFAIGQFGINWAFNDCVSAITECAHAYFVLIVPLIIANRDKLCNLQLLEFFAIKKASYNNAHHR